MLKLRFGVLLAACVMFSAAAAVSAQERLPRPKLVFTEKKDYESNGKKMTLYRLDVENKTDYPSEMFEAAPDLPLCGRNKNATRSWVDIFGERGNRIYGFCALKSPEELGTLAFNLPRGTRIGKVYIIIHDRQTNRKLKSEAVSVK